MSDFEFVADVFEWRGPAPYVFVRLPKQEAADIRAISREVTYGWGMIPVSVDIGKTKWETALWPKDGTYVLPLKDWVRRAERIELKSTISVSLNVRSAR